MGGQFSIFVLLNLCSESVGALRFEILADDSKVLAHLLLERNTYLLFNSNIENFVRKTDQERVEAGKQKALFC